MAQQAKKVDAVIVGLGWTGSIMAKELADEGLEVLALERGEDRDTIPDFAYPKIVDELSYAVRYKLMQNLSNSTLTIRRNLDETALPYRHLGSFLLGDGVGGAGVHWNGHTWRPQRQDLRLRSYVEETFGADIIPEHMHLQDFGVSYEELEPHFDRFEKVAGIAGKAGNLRGEIQEGGNPFEAPRQNEYPMPPLPRLLNDEMYAEATRSLGYHPFPMPAANASEAYTNPYGMQLGPCNFCGFCDRFGCLNYSKSSPQTCVLGAVKRMPNFSYKANSEVVRVELASDRKTATGVTYVDASGKEIFQPADLVVLAAYQMHNVHLLLLSGIGKPYDPRTGEGVVGRNYAYQVGGFASLFFHDKIFNPFVGAGAAGTIIDDFNSENIDYAKQGFIGGAYFASTQSNGQPIHSMSLPEGTPSWGTKWKQGTGQWYGHSMSVWTEATNMSYRDCYLDLDPTYTDRHGRALLRMTFDWKKNDLLMTQYMKGQVDGICRALEPDSYSLGFMDLDTHYDVRPYQTTHNVGGAVMGNDPATSVLNRYLQSWDVHNVFVMGSSAFPQNIQYNPTGLVGGLTYWAIEALRNDYLKQPRPLVQA